MQLFKTLLSLILVSFALSGCGNLPQPPVDIPDFVITGWLGDVGGPTDICSSVHTNSSSITPVHHTKDECMGILNGSVVIKGADFNTLVAGRDKLCTETGTCTYEQAQFVAKLNHMVNQIMKVNPVHDKKP